MQLTQKKREKENNRKNNQKKTMKKIKNKKKHNYCVFGQEWDFENPTPVQTPSIVTIDINITQMMVGKQWVKNWGMDVQMSR